jgi:hypothetical protein
MPESSDVIVPPMLYLPVLDDPETGSVAAIRELSDGRLGLLAYTALDRLADACGARQPWMLISTSELGRLKDLQHFDVIAFDIDVPPALRSGDRLLGIGETS